MYICHYPLKSTDHDGYNGGYGEFGLGPKKLVGHRLDVSRTDDRGVLVNVSENPGVGVEQVGLTSFIQCGADS
jgi:hypothetical protein